MGQLSGATIATVRLKNSASVLYFSTQATNLIVTGVSYNLYVSVYVFEQPVMPFKIWGGCNFACDVVIAVIMSYNVSE